MRGAVKLALPAFLAVLMVCAAPAAAEEPSGKTVLAFGDSLTAGYGLPRGESFPAKLEERLRAEGFDVTVINAGVSGDTTAGGNGRLGWTLDQHAPDYVILALGANDMLRAITPDATRDNLDKMLATIRARDIPVLLAGMRSPRSLGPAFFDSYNRMYRELAKKHGAVFYPFLLEGVAAQADLNQADGVHPNAAGVAVMVDGILPDVKKLLKK